MWNRGTYLAHHGRDGQKWGVQNGPPYPLKIEGRYNAGVESEAEKKEKKKESDKKWTLRDNIATNETLSGKSKEELRKEAKKWHDNVKTYRHRDLSTDEYYDSFLLEQKDEDKRRKKYVDENGNLRSKHEKAFNSILRNYDIKNSTEESKVHSEYSKYFSDTDKKVIENARKQTFDSFEDEKNAHDKYVYQLAGKQYMSMYVKDLNKAIGMDQKKRYESLNAEKEKNERTLYKEDFDEHARKMWDSDVMKDFISQPDVKKAYEDRNKRYDVYENPYVGLSQDRAIEIGSMFNADISKAITNYFGEYEKANIDYNDPYDFQHRRKKIVGDYVKSLVEDADWTNMHKYYHDKAWQYWH